MAAAPRATPIIPHSTTEPGQPGRARCPDPAFFTDDTPAIQVAGRPRSEEHTSELQSLMRISYAVFCLKKKKNKKTNYENTHIEQHQNTTKHQTTISDTTPPKCH